MIDSRELRLGNYVQESLFTFKFAQITSIDKKRVHVKYEFSRASLGIKDIIPIILTEEILIKCGFVLYGYGSTDDEFISSVEFTGYRLNNFDICFVNDTNKSIRFVNNINEKVYCNIKYLHQLQNLYFALTNEEITIQL